jgi:predicted amidophosphoribosyltransferase
MFAAALIDLVLPRQCLGCGAAFGPLCPRCLPVDPILRPDSWTCASAVYDGPVRAALIAYKERGRRDLVRPLAALLERAVLASAGPGGSRPGRVVLVPVPSARSVAAARGGDHMLRLARHVAAATRLRPARDALMLTRSVRDSAGLGPDERRTNLAGALAARPAPAGLAALVVDDIVTTGATLREARRALETAGWPVAGCAVIAATPRRTPSGS